MVFRPHSDDRRRQQDAVAQIGLLTEYSSDMDSNDDNESQITEHDMAALTADREEEAEAAAVAIDEVANVGAGNGEEPLGSSEEDEGSELD